MSACKLYVYDELMPVLRQALAMYMYAAFFMAAVLVAVALGLAASWARRAMRKPHDDWDDSEDHMRGAAYASRSKRSRDGRSSRRGSHRLALHRVEAARRESASSPCSTYCGVFTLMAFVIFATYVLAVKRVASLVPSPDRECVCRTIVVLGEFTGNLQVEEQAKAAALAPSTLMATIRSAAAPLDTFTALAADTADVFLTRFNKTVVEAGVDIVPLDNAVHAVAAAFSATPPWVAGVQLATAATNVASRATLVAGAASDVASAMQAAVAPTGNASAAAVALRDSLAGVANTLQAASASLSAAQVGVPKARCVLLPCASRIGGTVAPGTLGSVRAIRGCTGNSNCVRHLATLSHG